MPHYKVALTHRAKLRQENNFTSSDQRWEMTISDDSGTGRPTVQDVIQYFLATYPDQVVIDGSVKIEPFDPTTAPRGTVKFIEAECVVTFRYKRIINGHDVWEDGIMAINTNPFDQIKLSEAFQTQFPGSDIKDISMFFGTTAEYLAYLGIDENGDDKEDDIAKSFKRRSHRFAQLAIEKGDISVPRFTDKRVEVPAGGIVPCSECRFFVPEEEHHSQYHDGAMRRTVGRCVIPLPPHVQTNPCRVTDDMYEQGCVLGEREQ